MAGIIAGEQKEGSNPSTMSAVWQEFGSDADGKRKKIVRAEPLESVSGMAPECKLVSLKVLDEFGMGKASNVIAAIAHVQLLNGHGRELKIHGVNLSLGYSFDPKWFGCGHSPAVRRGQSPRQVRGRRRRRRRQHRLRHAADEGRCKRHKPRLDDQRSWQRRIRDHCRLDPSRKAAQYGVSYFSSKGPTGDGRIKPDLLAPGEKIISCAAANSELLLRETGGADCFYFENSGTSMAAPHVSGAIAAFLSIRSEFIGEAEKVKQSSRQPRPISAATAIFKARGWST